MKRNPDSVRRARESRAEMTNAETKLWSLLRDRRLISRKFRRQHPIGIYVVDFACPALHLVIEVDGLSHETEDQRAFDAQRTEYLQREGWRVIRFTNDEVYQSFGYVHAKICEEVSDDQHPLSP